jgi:porphobilinogen synthase
VEFNRLRRLRKKELLRGLLQESRISTKDLVFPLFVVEGKGKEEIPSMPGIFRFSIDELIEEVRNIHRMGIPAVLLFGVSGIKPGYEVNPQVYSEKGIVQRAIQAIKREVQDMVIITDVCLCAYTSHGHCGIVKPANRENIVDNDATLEILARVALSHARSGADIVAPSAMMDGQVRVIREALDENEFKDVSIMSYSVKYASNFYGPFREAAESAPEFGDRKSYQMDYHNLREALREVEEDIKEGADIVMVKPALAYLDVIRAVREKFNLPLAAYSVSGEYSMVKAYCSLPTLNISEKEIVLEILTSLKRAGADIIITYWAKEVAEWLRS